MVHFVDACALYVFGGPPNRKKSKKPKYPEKPKKPKRLDRPKKRPEKGSNSKMGKDGDKEAKVEATAKNEKSPKGESPKGQDRSKSKEDSKTKPYPVKVEDHKDSHDERTYERTRSATKGKEKAKENGNKDASQTKEKQESQKTQSNTSRSSGHKTQHERASTAKGVDPTLPPPEPAQVPVTDPWFRHRFTNWPQTAWHPPPVQYVPHPSVSQNRMQSIPLGERPPASGYELLAETLARNDHNQGVRPIYRRFDLLNHQLLLFLQDRLGHLGDQLSWIDAQDTQQRSYPGGIYPASLREAGTATNHELQRQKRDIMDQLAYNLSTYYNAIASFGTVRELPKPTSKEIREYIAFLSTQRPIVPAEAAFLNNSEDLVILSPKSKHTRTRPAPPSSSDSFVGRVILSDDPLRKLLMALAAAAIGSVSTFRVMTDFTTRMSVASVFFGCMLFMLLQSGVIGDIATTGKWPDALVLIAAYMALIASLAGVWP